MFKEYQSKAITRKAHEITENDSIEQLHDSTLWRLVTADGVVVDFAVHAPVVQVGDFVVYLNHSDVYHCERKVFFERNIVEPEHGAEPPRRTEIEQMMVDLGCKGSYISSEFIHSRIEAVDFQTIELAGNKFMYCGIRMKGGFVVTGHPAACIDPSNWRDEIGKKVSFENAFDEIYRLEAYRKMGAE